MRQLIFALCVSLKFTQSFGQFPVVPNAFNENGQRSGHWIIFYDSAFKDVQDRDSATYYRILYLENGKPKGKVRDYYKSGQKQWDGYLASILPDVYDGESNSYHENGALKSHVIFIDGKRTGPYINYTREGKVEEEGAYVNDLLHGKRKFYHPNGAVKYDFEMVNGEAEGEFTDYYDNGKINAKGKRLHNMQEGLWEYFYEDGTIKTRAHFHKNAYHGDCKEFNPSGQLLEEGAYIESSRNGHHVFYFAETGKIKEEVEYLAPRGKHGLWNQYHENGKLKSTGTMADGKEDGLFVTYHENGKVESEGTYAGGNKIGIWKSYFDDGILQAISNYKENILEGKFIAYFPNGAISWEGGYRNGLTTGIWKFYEQDGALTLQPFADGLINGERLEYFPNGHISQKSNYRLDTLHGLRTAYYENGQTRYQLTYENGRRSGVYSTWFPDGKLQMERGYLRDTLHGRYLDMYPSGKTQVSGSYVQGVATGLWEMFDDKGNLKETRQYASLNKPKQKRKQEISSDGAYVTQFYKDGTVSSKGRLVADKLEGHWDLYDTLGNKSSEGNYLSGQKNGLWKYYHPNGKLKTKSYFIKGFHETADNILDSVKVLLRIQEHDLALQHIEWYKTVLKRDIPPNHIKWAHHYAWLGEIYQSKREYEKALQQYQIYQQMVVRIQGDTTINFRLSLNGIANSLTYMERHEEALKINETVLAGKLSHEDRALYLLARGINLAGLKRAEEGAAGLKEEWKKQCAAFGEQSEEATHVLFQLITFERDYEQNYGNAGESIKRLLSYLSPDDTRYITCIRKMSEVYFFTHEYAESIKWSLKLLELERKGMTVGVYQYCLDVSFLATAYVQLSKFSSAGDLFAENIAFLRQENKIRSFGGGLLLGEYARLLTQKLGDESKALACAEEAKSILTALGRVNGFEYGNVLHMIASAKADHPYKAAGPLNVERDFKEAETFFRKTYGTSDETYYKVLLDMAGFYRGQYLFAKGDSVLKIVERDVPHVFGNDHYLLGRCYLDYGDLLILQLRYAESIRYYEKALPLFFANANNEPFDYGHVLEEKARAVRLKGDFAESERILREILAFYDSRSLANSVFYVRVQEQLAMVMAGRSAYSEAITLQQAVISGWAKLKGENDSAYRNAILALGQMYSGMGEYRLAEKHLLVSRSLYLKHPPTIQYVNTITSLAKLKFAMGKISEARAFFEEARLAANELEHNVNTTYLQDYAQFCIYNNQYALAKELLTEAAAVVKQNVGEDHYLFWVIALELSKVHRYSGELAESELYLQKALHYTEGHKEDANEHLTGLKVLAENYLAMGRYEEGEKIHTQLIHHTAEKYGKRNAYAVSLLDAAYLFLASGKYDSLKKYSTEAIRILQEEGAAPDNGYLLNALNLSGLASLKTEDYTSAEKCFRDLLNKRLASTTPNPSELAIAYHNTAAALSMLGKFEQAEIYFQKVMAINQEHAYQYSLEMESSLMDDVAILYQLWGKYELAERFWKKCIEALNSHVRTNFPFMSDYEKSKFWEKNKKTFEMYNTFAVKRLTTNKAVAADMYNYRMSTKGILLASSNKVRKRIYTSRDTVMINQYHEWVSLREQVAQEYARAASSTKTVHVDSLERVINALEKELSLSADEGREEQEKSLTWKDVQKSLSRDEAAIEFIRYHHFSKKLTDSLVYVALIITSEAKYPELVMFQDGKFLEGRAYNFYRNNIMAQIEDNQSFNRFWEPIAAKISSRKRVYLSLDGVFNQISFKTLRKPAGNFLIDEHDLVVVSNTRDLVAMKTRKRLRHFQSASLIGNPKFSTKKKSTSTRDVEDTERTSIAELPGTGVEIRNIESLLSERGWKVNSLTAGEANENRVKLLPPSRILHFATHGFFKDSERHNWSTADPMMRAGILLTGAANFIHNKTDSAGENGILTAYEAANLSLEGTEVVVLSACETAKGAVEQGEGVYGLQRAFMTAGAESLIMSLWKVDDVATQKMMSIFYNNWLQGMGKSEALNQAQRELSKEYPHPYFWGAFVMIRN